MSASNEWKSSCWPVVYVLWWTLILLPMWLRFSSHWIIGASMHSAGPGVVIYLFIYLSIWSKVQMICTWSSWCHCYSIISCFIKIQNGLTFLVPAYTGCSGKEAVKWVSGVCSVCHWCQHACTCGRIYGIKRCVLSCQWKYTGSYSANVVYSW